jgi:cytochrome c-type biogenesis protein CcmH/NrfG
VSRDRVIIFVILSFLAGFVIGAVSGIRFSVGDRPETGGPAPATAAPQMGQQIRDLERVLERDPKNLQALIALGNACFDMQQHKKAIDAYERALAIDPKNSDVRTDLGIMYRGIGDYDKALSNFREVTRQDPFHKNSRYNIGVVLQNDKKDIPGAIAAWEDFLKLEPTGERADAVRAELQKLKSLVK